MRKTIWIWAVVFCFITSCGNQSKETISFPILKTEVLIKTTPVKDQEEDSPSWIYAMLGTMESEHLMEGDSVNLSTAFLIRMWLQEQAVENYFSQENSPVSSRGIGPMALYLLGKYGAVPYDSYPDRKKVHDHYLYRKIEKITASAVGRKTGLVILNKNVGDCLDSEMGYLPAESVFMLGAEYTRKEFAHSVCTPGEYLWLTSFTHHPFYSYFALEIPGNTRHDKGYNLPIRQLIAHIEQALRHGHPVCWEGDTSNADFHGDKEISGRDIPLRRCTPQYRQQHFERLETTDDQALELIGLAHDPTGTEYFIARPQTEKKRPLYLSKSYLYLYTIAVTLSKAAYQYPI